MIDEKPPFYSNDDLRLIEHTVVDASSFAEFRENVLAFYGADNSRTGDIIVSDTLFHKFITDSAFLDEYDPVSKFEYVLRGFLGVVMNHCVFTDAYEHPDSPTRIFADGGKRPQMILLQQVLSIPA